MFIKNMVSKKGRAVPNQFEIRVSGGVYFQSYRSLIAFRSNTGLVTLDEEKWDYSRTTMKWLGEFLGENAKEIRRKIKKGIYVLGKLN